MSIDLFIGDIFPNTKMDGRGDRAPTIMTIIAEKDLNYSITGADLITYLRYSCQIAQLTTLAKRDRLVINTCQKLGIEIAESELQAAGDSFRQEHQLLSIAETQTWLSKQQITIEDWSEGIRIQLLTKKLKEHLFGDRVDTHYLSNRDNYKRVALSQIQVRDKSKALEIDRLLREENASFCKLALEYSEAKQSQQNGGFMGIRFVVELLPEIAHAIADKEEGAILEPIETKLGYHIIKIEKWFPPELTEQVRETIFNSLWQNERL